MASQAHAAPALAPRDTWLYRPSIDLLLGAGLAYVASIPLLALLSTVSGVGQWPVVAIWLVTLLISGPHYGATILRVYEHRRDRRRYAFFAVWVTLAL